MIRIHTSYIHLIYTLYILYTQDPFGVGGNVNVGDNIDAGMIEIRSVTGEIESREDQQNSKISL